MAVLGRNVLFWCIPCNRNLEGGGLTFEIRDDLKPQKEPEMQEEEAAAATDSKKDDNAEDKQSEAGSATSPAKLSKSQMEEAAGERKTSAV